jgi:hypothetical protein
VTYVTLYRLTGSSPPGKVLFDTWLLFSCFIGVQAPPHFSRPINISNANIGGIVFVFVGSSNPERQSAPHAPRISTTMHPRRFSIHFVLHQNLDTWVCRSGSEHPILARSRTSFVAHIRPADHTAPTSCWLGATKFNDAIVQTCKPLAVAFIIIASLLGRADSVARRGATDEDHRHPMNCARPVRSVMCRSARSSLI